MQINEKIKTTFKEFKIPYDDGVGYLLSLYHNLEISYIPEETKRKVLSTGIVQQDRMGIQWMIPLFEGQETNFKWVELEYIPLFADANIAKKGNKKDCIVRMKKFFAENPDVRKHEVIEATKYYISQQDDVTYLRMSHYFIYKDKGVNQTSDLANWVEIWRKVFNSDNEVSKNSLNTIMK